MILAPRKVAGIENNRENETDVSHHPNPFVSPFCNGLPPSAT